MDEPALLALSWYKSLPELHMDKILLNFHSWSREDRTVWGRNGLASSMRLRPTHSRIFTCLFVLHVSVTDSLTTEVSGLIKIMKKREKQVNDSQPRGSLRYLESPWVIFTFSNLRNKYLFWEGYNRLTKMSRIFPFFWNSAQGGNSGYGKLTRRLWLAQIPLFVSFSIVYLLYYLHILTYLCIICIFISLVSFH